MKRGIKDRKEERLADQLMKNDSEVLGYVYIGRIIQPLFLN
jgi:hypothetical protein